MRRSNFLIHWTGKDLGADIAALSPPVRTEYVARLMEILKTGFWMTTPLETIVGGNARSGPGSGSSFAYQAPMTCFTEIRLSSAAAHAQAYGLLGIAVDRRFILDRWGSPVHYVRNHPNEHVAASFFDLRYVLSTKFGTSPDVVAALHNVNYLGVFLKGMSAAHTDDFARLDEHEWRVVHTAEQEALGHIVRGPGDSPYRLLLPPKEVRLVVFPDSDTRTIATASPGVTSRLWSQGYHPPFLTVEECANF